MEPIEYIIRAAIGIPVVIVLMAILIPFAITIFALQVGIILAVAGYIVGIPWALWFRARNGFWPSPD